jgi:hypothetical protein
MLAAFVSLRVFTLGLTGGDPHPSEKYLEYITKVAHRAPHLIYFTIQHVNDYTFGRKQVNENWAVCDEAYPAP